MSTHAVRILSGAMKKDASQVLYPGVRPKGDQSVEVIKPGAVLLNRKPPPKFPDTMQEFSVEEARVKAQMTTLPSPEKPTLPRPHPNCCSSSHLVYVMIISRVHSGSVIKEILEGAERQLEVECMFYREYVTDLQLGLNELEGKQKKVDGWTRFTQVVTYVSSSVSIIAGTALTATGIVPIGVSLIIAGSAGVGNQVMHDTGGWDRVSQLFSNDPEKQKKITRGLEVGTSVITTLTSIGLGISAVQAGTHLAILAKFVTTATNVVGGVSTIGKGSCEIRTLKAQIKTSNDRSKLLQSKASVASQGKTVVEQSDQYCESTKKNARVLKAHRANCQITAAAAA